MFGIAALAALAYLPLAGRPVGMLRSLLKTGSVALLALGALTGGAPLLALALALCALGDWFLSRAGDRAFLAGVVPSRPGTSPTWSCSSRAPQVIRRPSPVHPASGSRRASFWSRSVSPPL